MNTPTTTTVKTKSAIVLAFRGKGDHEDAIPVIPSNTEIVVDLASVDAEEGIAEATWEGIKFPLHLGIDLNEIDWKLVVLNAKGLFLRDDTEIRKSCGKEFANAEEGYSLYSCHERIGFRRHHIYSGSRAFAVESAYQDAIVDSNFDKYITSEFV